MLCRCLYNASFRDSSFPVPLEAHRYVPWNSVIRVAELDPVGSRTFLTDPEFSLLVPDPILTSFTDYLKSVGFQTFLLKTIFYLNKCIVYKLLLFCGINFDE